MTIRIDTASEPLFGRASEVSPDPKSESRDTPVTDERNGTYHCACHDHSKHPSQVKSVTKAEHESDCYEREDTREYPNLETTLGQQLVVVTHAIFLGRFRPTALY